MQISSEKENGQINRRVVETNLLNQRLVSRSRLISDYSPFGLRPLPPGEDVINEQSASKKLSFRVFVRAKNLNYRIRKRQNSLLYQIASLSLLIK